MLSANIIEPSGRITLRNNILVSSNTEVGQTGYACRSYTYETPIRLNRVYYYRFSYKYTTTNQVPTQVSMYAVGDMKPCGAQLTPSTSYQTASAIYTCVFADSGWFVWNGSIFGSKWMSSIYQMPSSGISGVTGYTKDLICYDVTDLYTILQVNGIVTNTTALKTWCDSNLEWKACGVDYDITSKVSTTVNGVKTKDAVVYGELVEADGMCQYAANDTFKTIANTYFDDSNSLNVYNNKANGTVTHTREIDTSNPFYPTHKYVIKIITDGTASPGLGGFHRTWQSRANEVVIEKVIAKIPEGYSLAANHNTCGTGYTYTYLSDMKGTGKYEEYSVLYKCGSSGTFSTSGFLSVYATGSSSTTSVTWYVAYVQFCDITDKEDLMNFTALPGKANVRNSYVFTSYVDSMNLFTNGDGSNTEMVLGNNSLLSWDKTAISGNAKASIVQGVSSSNVDQSYRATSLIPFDSTGRYKISFWIKAPSTLTNNLWCAIKYFNSSGQVYNANNLLYVTGTKTTLTADLNSGDTQIQVASNANWVSKYYSYLSFRNGYSAIYYQSMCSSKFNPNGSTGVVKGTSGSNIILLNSAYSGTTMKTGQVICEGYANYTYQYIATLSDATNDWVYKTIYIGNDGYNWDGAGSVWQSIPHGARYISFMPNVNYCTDKVYISDFRIEEVGKFPREKQDGVVQLKKLS